MKKLFIIVLGDIMIKSEYAKIISEKTNVPKYIVQNVIDEFIELLSDEIASNEKTKISSFGTFQKSFIKAKNQFSPIDGSKSNNEYFRISFKCSKELTKKLHEKK